MAMSTGKVVALIQAMGSSADPAVIESAVQDWLDNHPEATTTVQDGSITEQKLATSIAQKLGLISSLSDEIAGLNFSVVNGGSASKTFAVSLPKGYEYTYTNNSTSGQSLNITFTDDTTETLSNNLKAGQSIRFKKDKDIKNVFGWYNASANFTITAKGLPDALSANAENALNCIFDKCAFMAFHKFGVIGDSLSVGYTGNPITGQDINRNIAYSWPQFLARMCGNVALNFGFSGLTTKTWLTSAYGKTRFINPDNYCQAYILALGVNDVNSLTLGTADDIGTDADTFYRYYGEILTLINSTTPNAKIFLFTMPYPSTATGFNNAIRSFASNNAFSNVFLVDLAQNYNDLFRDDRINGEKSAGHFSCTGYANIAGVNAVALSDVMNANASEFVSVPFIPYGSNDILD